MRIILKIHVHDQELIITCSSHRMMRIAIGLVKGRADRRTMGRRAILTVDDQVRFDGIFGTIDPNTVFRRRPRGAPAQHAD